MTEEIDSSAHRADPENARVTRRRDMRTGTTSSTASNRTQGVLARAGHRISTAAGRAASAARKPAKSLVIFSMVGGLVATVALPAYAAWKPESEAVTIQQVAAENAQSLVVASSSEDGEQETLARDSYSATTSEEIEKKKAEEAAAARAAELAESVSTAAVSVDLSMTAPGSGEVRWPVTNFTYSEINLFRPPSRPNHNGFDMLAPAGTPIYAAAAGTVRTSQESLGGYGVAIVIDHVIGGQVVSTLYGHMTYGSRQVQAGQTVEAGQLIGLVGSTGSSTANHLHFEVTIGGTLVDPLPWLQTNAG